MRPMTLAALAEHLGLKLRGEDAAFSGLSTLEEAGPTDLSFLGSPKYAPLLQTTQALALIVDEHHADAFPRVLISSNPHVDFARAAAFFVRAPSDFSGISEQACVHPSARLEDGVTIYPFCYVGARTLIRQGTVLYPGVFVGDDCVIGQNSLLYPCSVVLAGIQIGADCRLHSGAVIGTEGFGHLRHGGRVLNLPQIGSVQLAEGVEVGANSCIDRATYTATSVARDTKIDNLVQIGHNVSVGEQCFLIAQVGIAGSTKVGNRVTLAGQAGIAGHLKIGDDVTVGPKAGVAKDIAPGIQGSGCPFMEEAIFFRHAILQPKLPDLVRRVRQLEKELKALQDLMAQHTEQE